MLASAAALLNIDLVVLDVGDRAPAKQIFQSKVGHLDGAFSDPLKIQELASKSDVLTVEIEHVNVDALEVAGVNGKIQVHPAPSTLRTIQDKFLQKEHLARHTIPVSEYCSVGSTEGSLLAAGERLGFPLMLKSRTLAYDGRGNLVVKDPSEAATAIGTFGDRPLYAEKWVPFVKEVAVMVVRSARGEVRSYPVVETVHKDNICHLVFAPLRYPDSNVTQLAKEVAERAIQTFEGAGVFGVEMFLLADGMLLARPDPSITEKPPGSFLVNEIAPRPHNSGHYTIEACLTSQYENHLRAILGLPLGSTDLKVPSAIMLNILGRSSSMDDLSPLLTMAYNVPGASVHLYGKQESRVGRKLGHITIVGSSDFETRARLRPLLAALDDPDIDTYAPLPRPSHSAAQPLVGIIMGSDSDLPVMIAGARILDDFKIPYELTIVSAHRTPERLRTYAQSAASRGLRVVIAGAGGAAHLPGMVASMTTLPVIGVPVKGSSLDGVDSLYSIVQMPVGAFYSFFFFFQFGELTITARYPCCGGGDQQ